MNIFPVNIGEENTFVFEFNDHFDRFYGTKQRFSWLQISILNRGGYRMLVSTQYFIWWWHLTGPLISLDLDTYNDLGNSFDVAASNNRSCPWSFPCPFKRNDLRKAKKHVSVYVLQLLYFIFANYITQLDKVAPKLPGRHIIYTVRWSRHKVARSPHNIHS